MLPSVDNVRIVRSQRKRGASYEIIQEITLVIKLKGKHKFGTTMVRWENTI